MRIVLKIMLREGLLLHKMIDKKNTIVLLQIHSLTAQFQYFEFRRYTRSSLAGNPGGLCAQA